MRGIQKVYKTEPISNKPYPIRILEQKLKRKILKTEQVLIVDGNPRNLHPDNLMVVPKIARPHRREQ